MQPSLLPGRTNVLSRRPFTMRPAAAVSSLLALACTALAAADDALAGGAGSSPAFLTVKTTNGPITGHAASNSDRVLEYLGIPYAKPPVGELRFAPPQRFRSNVPYEAARFGFDCPLTPSPPVDYPGFTPQAQRVLSYFASGAGTNKSEDCLTLNIWAKTTDSSFKSEKPVIVFFYGGRKLVLMFLAMRCIRSWKLMRRRLRCWQHQQSVLQRQILCRRARCHLRHCQLPDQHLWFPRLPGQATKRWPARSARCRRVAPRQHSLLWRRP